jgi:predicted O-methyltransferase YrrM
MTLRRVKEIVLAVVSISFRFLRPVGQVGRKSEFGRWIELLSSLQENIIIVEIGTWNGRGTSRQIATGNLKRSDPSVEVKVFGFEIDFDRYQSARKYLARYRFFNVIHGSIITEEQLDRSNLSGDEVNWLNQDIAKMQKAPFALDLVPESIDLLILDGGEFSTYAEFHLLENRITNWVLLDDIYMRKCRSLFTELSESSQYLLVGLSSERNGTAVFRKLPL